MKLLVIDSGDAFSTKDVFDGLVSGLKANGAEVYTYPLCTNLQIMEAMTDAAKALQVFNHEPDPYNLAAAGIPGVAMYRQVDAVIAVTGMKLPFGVPLALKRGGYLTALLCTESPYLTAERERHDAACYDVVFTNDRSAVPLFDRSAHVHYLPHAYRADVHTPDGPRADPCDVFFVGTLFPERRALFDGIDWTGINRVFKVFDYDNRDDPTQVWHGIMPNDEAATFYRSARISINHHRTIKDHRERQHITDAYSLNPRVYEIAACGGFQVCDASRPELFAVFGDSIPTYTDSASLGQLLRYYLRHEDERQALAARQRAAALAHSWTQRAATVLDVLRQHHH